MEVKREKAFAFHLKGTVQCRDPDREMRCGGGGEGGKRWEGVSNHPDP